MKIGLSNEWRGIKIEEVPQTRIKILDLGQRDQIDNESQENPNGCLNKQWVRRDLLGMPKKWYMDENKLILVIPSSALERVQEELDSFEVEFEIVD